MHQERTSPKAMENEVKGDLSNNEKVNDKADHSPEQKAEGSLAEMRKAVHGFASCYFTQDRQLRILINIDEKREDLPFHTRNARVAILGALKSLGINVEEQDFRRLIRELETEAEIHATKQKQHVRYAEHDGAIFIDLANKAGQQIKVTGDGHEVIAGSDSPVVFGPDKNRRELPIPVEGGSLAELKDFACFETEDDYTMCASGAVAACVPGIPKPLILIQGEQGSGKSTLAGILQELIDPVAVSFVPLPKNDAEFLRLARERSLFNVDNVSGISPNQSDTLCRTSTGIGGHGDPLTRPVILNGITVPVTRPDLAERLLTVQLMVPPPEERKTSVETKARFAERSAAIFGAKCDALSLYLRNRDQVNPENLHRMADVVKCCIAIEPALAIEEGAFLAAYESKRSTIHNDTVENDPVALGVIKLIASKGEFEGTATEALGLIREILKDDPEWMVKDLPRQPNVFSSRLKRLVPVLRENYIEVEWNRSDRRVISIREILHADLVAPSQGSMREYAETSLRGAPLADNAEPKKAERAVMERGTV